MPVSANIRMYNQLNLGDCFLLKFNSGEKTSFVMIDFGSYEGTNKDREIEIAKDIKNIIGDHALIIVLTHQHKDHLSGFLTAGDFLKGKDRTLWLSYLDSEKSKEGQQIRSMTEKYWHKTKKTKELLNTHFPNTPKVQDMLKEKDGFDAFAEGQTGGAAITKLLEIANNNVQFLTPGDCFSLPNLNGEVNVYVLGPPFDKALLTKMNPNKDEEVQGLNSMMELANMDISGTLMLDALEGIDGQHNPRTHDFPFNRRYIDDDPDNELKGIYDHTENDWRRIDHEWLNEVGRLSLYMDRLTNNTSLVLAFELVTSKKVLLFVGDAQIGNWKSWFNIEFGDTGVTGEDLLSRTVVYKAGHHSSHNATLKQGLDLMNEKDLIILIPVNEGVSTKFKFAMLRPEMLKGYNRKSQGRVLRADTIEQKEIPIKTDFVFKKRGFYEGSLKIFPENSDPHLGIELTISDTPAAANSGTIVTKVFDQRLRFENGKLIVSAKTKDIVIKVENSGSK